VKITLCASCDLGQGGFDRPLAAALAQVGLAVDIGRTDCMSGCAQGSTLAFRAPGKTAYLFGRLTAADLPDLVTFARLYAASPDGNFPDARVLGALRSRALARIPG
jgi:predicted metal-binding protein